MAKVKKGKARLHERNFQARLFHEDGKEVLRRVSAGKSEADVLRELISFALRQERLIRGGKDEALDAVRGVQKEVVGEGIGPLVSALEATGALVERTAGLMHGEYVAINERLSRVEGVCALLSDGFDRILQNQILVRGLLYHYVYSFYYTVLVQTDQKLTPQGVAEALKGRITTIKIEATKVRKLCDEATFEKIVETVGRELLEAPKDLRGLGGSGVLPAAAAGQTTPPK